MPGVRIRPLPHKNVPDDAWIFLRDESRPIAYKGVNKYGERWADVAPVCATCHQQHAVKTYHLRIRAGTVIVGKPIWERFQQLPDNGGFEFVNIVEDPPAQGLTPGQETELIEKFPVNNTNAYKGIRRLGYLLKPRKGVA